MVEQTVVVSKTKTLKIKIRDPLENEDPLKNKDPQKWKPTRKQRPLNTHLQNVELRMFGCAVVMNGECLANKDPYDQKP